MHMCSHVFHVYWLQDCPTNPTEQRSIAVLPAVAERLPNEGEDLSSGLILLQRLLRQRDAPLT